MRLKLCALAALIMLAACGGGGSDGGQQAGPSPVGLWQGPTSSGRTAFAAVLSSGEIWAIYTAAGGSAIAGAAQGHWSSSANTIASSDALDFNLESGQVFPVTASGTFAPGQNLLATLNYPNGSKVSVVGSPMAGALNAMAAVAGTYRGPATTGVGTDTVTMTATVAGALSGSSALGCQFTGTATPRTDVQALDVSVTFKGSPCALGTQTVTGIAVYQPSTHQLVSAALNSARTGGFLFLGAHL